MYTSRPRRDATRVHGSFPTKPINILLPRSITATSRSNRSTPSAPQGFKVIVDQYSSPGLAPSPTASERQPHESSPWDNEHTHPDMPLSPPPYMPSVSELFNAHRRDSTHVGYLGHAQPFGRALLAGPSLSPMKVPRSDLSASASNIAHTRAFSTLD